MQLRLNKGGDHSLTPDMYTGWRSNLTQHQFKQFPIYFTNPEADMISKSLTSFGTNQPYRVVYMGPRHTSNHRVFKAYSKTFDSEDDSRDEFSMYGGKFDKYEFSYLKEKEKIFPIRPLQYRLFTGMNPTMKKTDLQFDSNFQCGNLDLAILVNPFEYDLLMRVDSNTKGHTTWFYFKVKNFTNKQKVRLNLINFQKSGLLYNEGMKPYCFRSSKKDWEQARVEVEYRNKRFRYCREDDEDAIFKRCLSFTFQFDGEDQYVYFSYCVPYSYSYLMHQVIQLQKENPHIVDLNLENCSTGGLTIPILTITSTSTVTEKQTCMAIGRLHPGETQGSWMIDGFLRFICSQKAYYLRQKFVFKIIPMVNVDGVVLGNFRTSINGRDLNRFFHRPDQYQEISLVREVAQRIKPLIFLDFHGHSTKRNVFTYGPNYGVDHKYYLTCRLLPKIISKLTSAFRYYSCQFKVSESKVNASRAVMIRDFGVIYSFTIEASSHAFGPKIEQKYFSNEAYRAVGESIAESLIKFFVIAFKLPKRLENQKEQKERGREVVSPSMKERRGVDKEKKKDPVSNLFNLDKSILQLFSDDKELLQELMDDQKKMIQIGKEEGSKEGTQPVSDSDFEQGCEYSDKELKAMLKTQKSDESGLMKKKSIPKKKKKKKGSKSKLQALSPSPSPQKEKSYTLPVKEKSQMSLQRKLYPMKPRIQRKLKVISVQQLTSPKMPSVKSSILEPSSSFLDYLQPSTETDVFNKVLYKNWKKIQNSSEIYPSSNFEKVQSVNHINLSYSELESKEEESQYQRLHEKAALVQHIGKRSKKKLMFLKEKEWSQKKNTEGQEVMCVKDSKLPFLNKNSFNERMANISYLEALLENSGKVQDSYARKNLKIMYF